MHRLCSRRYTCTKSCWNEWSVWFCLAAVLFVFHRFWFTNIFQVLCYCQMCCVCVCVCVFHCIREKCENSEFSVEESKPAIICLAVNSGDNGNRLSDNSYRVSLSRICLSFVSVLLVFHRFWFTNIFQVLCYCQMCVCVCVRTCVCVCVYVCVSLYAWDVWTFWIQGWRVQACHYLFGCKQ